MTWRTYLLLGLAGLAVALTVAAFQPVPGYMDADYYYAGGLQLAAGRGFTEPYLWNFLDDPTGLPHPSHGYWMPLASLLAAAGASLFGPGSWSAARIGFLLVAAGLPPVTAAISWSLASRRDLALTSGLLAVFSGFYLPFLTTTETFGLYMLLGGLFVLLVIRNSVFVSWKRSLAISCLLGILAGLMHLTRADGLLWLLVAFAAILFVFPKPPKNQVIFVFCFLFFASIGYLLVMAPWFVRNYDAFGSFLAPGGSKMLWLTGYNELFSYPASQLTFQRWWSSGLGAILSDRVWSLGMNLATLFSVQGGIFLFPLILVALWNRRREKPVLLVLFAWLLTFAAMTLAFPYAGAHGGYFHSGAALQTVWWALAPLGLEPLLAWGTRTRGWSSAQAGPVFRSTLVILSIILTAIIIWTRVLGGGQVSNVWAAERNAYNQINAYLLEQEMAKDAVVMVANPPGFYLASGHSSVSIPDGDVSAVLAVAERYGVDYLILEEGSTPAGLISVYESPMGWAGLVYLGETETARVYRIQP